MSEDMQAAMEALAGIDGEAEDTEQYLAFRVDDGEYGIGIGFVRDIIRIEAITPVPFMHSHVKGIMNLRGTIIPIVDMKELFSRGETALLERTCVVVLSSEETTVGIIVDEVQEVLKDMGEGEIQAPPSLNGQKNAYVSGIVVYGGRVRQLLDAEKIFRAENAEGGEGAAG